MELSPRRVPNVVGQVMAPSEFQGVIIAGINRRTGIVQSSDIIEDGMACTIQADVPLAQVGFLDALFNNDVSHE